MSDGALQCYRTLGIEPPNKVARSWNKLSNHDRWRLLKKLKLNVFDSSALFRELPKNTQQKLTEHYAQRHG